MICLHRNGCRCQIRTLRTRFRPRYEAPFFAQGWPAGASPSGISSGRDIWRRTMQMRRTTYWEPCLAPERCGSSKSTWTCPSGITFNIVDQDKDKEKDTILLLESPCSSVRPFVRPSVRNKICRIIDTCSIVKYQGSQMYASYINASSTYA